MAEAHYPGTAVYFDSPIWAVLQGDQMDQWWIDDQLKAMSPEIAEILNVSAPPLLQENLTLIDSENSTRKRPIVWRKSEHLKR